MLTLPNTVHLLWTKVLKLPTEGLTCMSEWCLMRLHPPCNGWQKTPLFTHLKQGFAAKKEGNPPYPVEAQRGEENRHLCQHFSSYLTIGPCRKGEGFCGTPQATPGCVCVPMAFASRSSVCVYEKLQTSALQWGPNRLPI